MVSSAYLAGRSARIPITETVSLTPHGASAITSLTAERRPMTIDSPVFSGDVSLIAKELEFVLRNNQLSGTVPKSGDLITDASSVVYRIERTAVRLAGSRHHCAVVQHR